MEPSRRIDRWVGVMTGENADNVIERAVRMGVSKEQLQRAAASLVDDETGGGEGPAEGASGGEKKQKRERRLSLKQSISRLESLHADEAYVNRGPTTSAKVAPSSE